VVGGGPMGILLTLVLKVNGVRHLTVVARRPRGALCARELGAEVVEGSLEECTEALRTRRPEGFGAAVECTGRPEVWEESVHLVRPGGRVLLFGGLARDTRIRFDAGRLHYDEITVTGSFHYTTEDALRAYGLLPRAAAELARLVSHTRPLQEVASVFEELDRGMDALKVALFPDVP
jgi:L-iditol 2-dehydrogenase